MRRAACLGLGTLLSRLLGLARDMLFALVLGGGPAADLFLAAFRAPHLARRLLQEGSFYLPFIPLFQRERGASAAQAFAFGRAAALGLALVALLLALLGLPASEALAGLFLPGAGEEFLSSAAGLLRLGFFYLPLAALAAVSGGMLLALNRPRAPALGPAVFNLGMLAAGAAALCAGAGAKDAAFYLCWGILAGGALHFILQALALRGQGFRWAGPLHKPAGLAFLRRLPLALCGASAMQINMLLAACLAASAQGGGISALYYAERLLELPLALSGAALGTAGLADMSAPPELATGPPVAAAPAGPGAKLRKLLDLGFFLTLPAAAGLAICGAPIVGLLFGHGAFDSAAEQLTALTLLYYAPALPAACAVRLLLSALHIQGAGSLIAWAACSALASVAVMLLSAPALAAALGPPGLACGVSLAAWVNVPLLAWPLRRSLGQRFFPWAGLGLYAILGLAAAAAARLTIQCLSRAGAGPGLSLPAAICLAALLYMGLAAVLSLPGYTSLAAALPRRRA